MPRASSHRSISRQHASSETAPPVKRPSTTSQGVREGPAPPITWGAGDRLEPYEAVRPHSDCPSCTCPRVPKAVRPLPLDMGSGDPLSFTPDEGMVYGGNLAADPAFGHLKSWFLGQRWGARTARKCPRQPELLLPKNMVWDGGNSHLPGACSLGRQGIFPTT